MNKLKLLTTGLKVAVAAIIPGGLVIAGIYGIACYIKSKKKDSDKAKENAKPE